MALRAIGSRTRSQVQANGQPAATQGSTRSPFVKENMTKASRFSTAPKLGCTYHLPPWRQRGGLLLFLYHFSLPSVLPSRSNLGIWKAIRSLIWSTLYLHHAAQASLVDELVQEARLPRHQGVLHQYQQWKTQPESRWARQRRHP